MKQRSHSYLDIDDRLIPMHFPRLLVELASEQCADRAGLLSGTGIALGMLESADARISLRQYTRLCRNALRLTDNPGLGIDLGRRIHFANLGVLGLAVMGSADVRSVIELCLRYYRLLAPVWDLSFEVTGDSARFTAREAVALRGQQVLATEILLVSMLQLGRTLLGHAFPIQRIDLSYPKPPHARRYAEITDAAVRFSQPVTQVIIDAAVLDTKLPSPDPVTVHAARRLCEASLMSMPSTGGLVANVRRLLEATPGRYPSMKELAKKLGTGERTLRRDLLEMGTSYQAQLDIARCKHATDLLLGTDMSIQEIADTLSFSEGSALRRAFKRWTGQTAMQYRRDNRGRTSDAQGS